MTLFDPDEYGKATEVVKREKAHVPVAPTITLGVGRWILVGRRRAQSQAHIRYSSWGAHGSIKTECGVIGAPLSHDPGAQAPGCYKCLAAVESDDK